MYLGFLKLFSEQFLKEPFRLKNLKHLKNLFHLKISFCAMKSFHECERLLMEPQMPIKNLSYVCMHFFRVDRERNRLFDFLTASFLLSKDPLKRFWVYLFISSLLLSSFQVFHFNLMLCIEFNIYFAYSCLATHLHSPAALWKNITGSHHKWMCYIKLCLPGLH